MRRTKIVHISTGGTIEGIAPEYKEIDFMSRAFSDITDIQKYITLSFKLNGAYALEVVCRKDSREISEKDRTIILKKIKKHFALGVRHFLITHGTYTMPETGVFLLENLPKKIIENAGIVITGALYPLNLIGSDALMNVGAALSTLLNMTEPVGVKISMHGTNWDPRTVRKNADKLIFEEQK